MAISNTDMARLGEKELLNMIGPHIDLLIGSVCVMVIMLACSAHPDNEPIF